MAGPLWGKLRIFCYWGKWCSHLLSMVSQDKGRRSRRRRLVEQFKLQKEHWVASDWSLFPVNSPDSVISIFTCLFFSAPFSRRSLLFLSASKCQSVTYDLPMQYVTGAHYFRLRAFQELHVAGKKFRLAYHSTLGTCLFHWQVVKVGTFWSAVKSIFTST